jgi:hypothetical protein
VRVIATTYAATVTDPTTPPPADDIELSEVGELMVGYDWLAMTCNVIQTIAIALIAITLIARL